jgi:hypothetical protein
VRADARRWLVALSLCAALPARAEEATPDLDFLEYLGTLVAEGDGWIDAQDVAPPEEPTTAAQTMGLPPEWEE